MAHRCLGLFGLTTILSIASCSRLVPTPTPAKLDPQSEPGFHVVSSVKPCLKLRKRFFAFGSTASAGCSYDIVNGATTFEAKVRETLFGGTVGLTNLSSVEWSKTWLYPGLLDAATRVELRSCFDLSTGKVDAELRLGLRRAFSRKGLSLVHSLPLDSQPGHFTVDIGATLTVPEEVRLSLDDVRKRKSAFESLRFEVDFDRLDLCVDY